MSAQLTLTTERRLLPTDTAYASIEKGPGESHVARNDLGGDAAALTAPGATVLLRLLHLTDLHVLDAASPARCEWVEARSNNPKWHPLLHMARTFDTLAIWGVAAIAASVFGSGSDLVDIAIATGDNIDNAQRNELDAYLALLDGGTFSFPYEGVQRTDWANDMRADHLRTEGLWPFWVPDAGTEDMWRSTHGFPAIPGLLDAAGSPCSSTGLGLPWLGVLGNHDVMSQGTVYVPESLDRIAVGSWAALSPGPAFDPPDPFKAYMTDPTSFSDGEIRRPVSPVESRHSITRAEFVRAHIDSGGHGFADETSGDYVHDTEHVRIVVLDTNHPTGHYQGSIGRAQLDWLDATLDADPTRPVLVVSHHGQASMDNTYATSPTYATSSTSPTSPDSQRCLGDAMAEVLHRHDNVVAWLVGHRHVHRIQACPDPTGRGPGFWEVTTSSIIDWPNQARIVEIIRGTDGTVGVRTTVVDHDSIDTSEHAPSSTRLPALHRELAYNSGRVYGERHRDGRPTDRNTILARPSR